MKKVKLFEEYIQEATTSWGKMMKGVKAGDGGPWSIVAIENNKVVGQSIDIKIRDLIPAKYEALKKEFPRAKFHIEDGGGGVVWNESLNEEFDVSKIKAKDTIELTNTRTGDVGKYTVKRIFGGSSDIKEIEVLTRNKQLLTLYYSKERGLQNFKGDVYESFVNEAKDATRDELMDLMETKYKIKTVRPSEDFNGQTGGIWIAADNEEELGGNKIFDYYNRSSKYSNGVLTQLRTAVEKRGWWFEWNDPGTMMCWPKN